MNDDRRRTRRPTEEETAELTITRAVDAPRERVWKAWTDPKQVAEWWGPNGFTNTIHEMDVRPGGVWRFVMHGPDGADYHNEFVYDEIVEPEGLAYIHPPNEENDFLRFQVMVTFDEGADGGFGRGRRSRSHWGYRRSRCWARSSASGR